MFFLKLWASIVEILTSLLEKLWIAISFWLKWSTVATVFYSKINVAWKSLKYLSSNRPISPVTILFVGFFSGCFDRFFLGTSGGVTIKLVLVLRSSCNSDLFRGTLLSWSDKKHWEEVAVECSGHHWFMWGWRTIQSLFCWHDENECFSHEKH